MTRRTILLLPVLCFLHTLSFAQVTESFADNDFTQNPAWTGQAADWTINSLGQLQSNNTLTNAAFQLSTANALSMGTEWECFVRLNFNTSSLNYTDIYLTASAADLSLNTTTGYLVRIGSAQDDICLFRKDAGGLMVKLIDGTDGCTNFSDNTLKIKVVRTASGQFTLFRDNSGTGLAYVTEGSATDPTYTASSFFGFLVRQSTSSFFQKHFFDEILVRPHVPDLLPPSVQNIFVTAGNQLDLLFSETVEPTSAQNPGFYSVSNGILSPASAQRDPANGARVRLDFSTAFTPGTTYTLAVTGVTDLSGNVLTNGAVGFTYQEPAAYDVVIDEIMADPEPPVGLPVAEFIELKNRSTRTIHLGGWKLRSGTTVTAAFPAYDLPPDSFLVLTSPAQVPALSGFGRVLGISGFPALPRESGLLTLLSREGKTMHAVSYHQSWYQNPIKAEGGWTLEMIDTRNPCSGAGNWKAAVAPEGGSPGKRNSVDAPNPDQYPPRLIRTYSPDSLTVVACFDEPLDSSQASSLSFYKLEPSLPVLRARPLAPLFQQVQLELGAPLQADRIYELTVTGLTDCQANAIGQYSKAKAGRAREAAPGDVVINELLFDPRPTGVDYLECYNRSSGIIDASRLLIASRTATNGLTAQKKWSETPWYIFPGDYVVLTEDPVALGREYLVKNEQAVLTIKGLPSLPDDKGSAVVLNAQGVVVDETAYDRKWHFALITDPEGVALERLDPAGKSTDPMNWHSAASTSGYGTPGYKNSQYIQADAGGEITVMPKVFSPDNDGLDDVLTITYQTGSPGFVANIFLFDAQGRLVRHLVKNDLLGVKGSWSWDGLDEKRAALPSGIYVVFTEWFDLNGKKQSFKHAAVLARKRN